MFLLTNEILKLLLSERWSSSSRSNSVTFSCDSFSKAYTTSETENFFLNERLDHPDKLQNTQFCPYDTFYNKPLGCKAPETELTDYVNLLKSKITTEQAVFKLKLSKSPLARIWNYQHRQQKKQHQMSSFNKFLRRYNNKLVVPTLEAVRKLTAVYQDKNNAMLRLGCTLPVWAKNCVDKSADAKLYPGRQSPLESFGKLLLVSIYHFET